MLSERDTFIDILTPIILLNDHLNIDIYKFITENITSENIKKIFTLDKIEWIDNTRISIIKQLNMLADRFFNNEYQSDDKINKMFTYFKKK
jgi:hypothetical protein